MSILSAVNLNYEYIFRVFYNKKNEEQELFNKFT